VEQRTIRPRIADVAREAGVSKTAVSFAFNCPERDLGLDVPGDVSVVGFDDIDLASHVEPPLTTVHQPIRQKGEEAVRLLLAVVGKTGGAVADHRRLETRLIVRGSSGQVRPPR
jgi:DNA-binding LacI/PurR family transcriptional regulator